ncbi:MAG: hypothetical protein ACRDA3_14650 [Peptostreptococcaceae bacterium]
MNNTNTLINENIYCEHCDNEMKYLLSNLNAQYYYCEVCDYNNENARKHMVFDSILKYINDSVVKIVDRRIEEINIHIYKDNKKLLLTINNYKLIAFNSIQYINEKDLAIFSNTLNYTIEDILGEGTVKISISYEYKE